DLDVSVLKLLRGVTLNNLITDVLERVAPTAGTHSEGNGPPAPPSFPRSDEWRAEIAAKGPRDFTLAVSLGAEAAAHSAAECSLEPDVGWSSEGTAPELTAVGAAGILLTGAPGFLGAFLLHDLLCSSPGPVRCLVRCGSSEEGAQRLRRNLASYLIWDESFTE